MKEKTLEQIPNYILFLGSFCCFYGLQHYLKYNQYYWMVYCLHLMVPVEWL